MKFVDRVKHGQGADAGVGIITVVLVMAVITALAITATKLTINNVGNVTRDRQALAALATSEAGVAQAIAFLRGGNLGALTCPEPAPGIAPGLFCQGAGPSWISATNPKQVRLDGTAGACTSSIDCFSVWIGTVKKYEAGCPGRRATPPKPCTGVYRVHSTGVSGNGPGARRLAVDVEAAPYPFPIGVFAESFSGNGNVGIHRQSVFTNGCVINRQRDDTSGSGFQFEYDTANGRPLLDIVYDQPAAAHSTNLISTSNNVCGDGAGGQRIHKPGLPACNPLFRFDQSDLGAALTPGDGCHSAYVRSDGSVYPTTSKFTLGELQRYGYRPRGLTDAQFDALKTQAQAQGTYNIAIGSVSTVLTSLAAGGITSPVLYWDSGDIVLKDTDFPAAFKRLSNTSGSCSNSSVTVVVSGPGSDLKYSGGNSGPFLTASIFVPDGEMTGQGGTNTIGTVFAKTLDLGGSPDFFMDQCFASNPPGGTLDVEIINFREDDATDIS